MFGNKSAKTKIDFDIAFSESRIKVMHSNCRRFNLQYS